MAKCLVGVAGGISANDKGKLIPENIRAGVTLFEGTSKQIEGGFFPDPVLFAYAGNRGNSMATCMVIDEACGLFNYSGPSGGGYGGVTVKKAFVGHVTVYTSQSPDRPWEIAHCLAQNGARISANGERTFSVGDTLTILSNSTSGSTHTARIRFVRNA